MSKKALDAIWVAVREAGGEEVIKDILRYTLKKVSSLQKYIQDEEDLKALLIVIGEPLILQTLLKFLTLKYFVE